MSGIILIIFFVIIFSNQDQATNKSLSIAPPLQNNPEFENFVELKIIRENHNQRNFPIIIQNLSEKEITWGNAYLVEYYDNGTWKSILSKVEFTEIGIPIPSQSFKINNINLTTDYPNDFSGLFRIRVSIHSDGDLTTLHDLTTEFILE